MTFFKKSIEKKEKKDVLNLFFCVYVYVYSYIMEVC